MDNFISDAEVLQYAIECGILDSATIKQSIIMAKRQEILKAHKYAIFQGKDGKWYTHVYADGKRRLIKKNTKGEVEEKIIDLFQDNPSVNEVFKRWTDEKLHYNEIQKSTYDRYTADYHRYFDDSDLKYKKIESVTEEQLETFIKDKILQHDLTSKAYGNLRTVIIGIFGYAYKHKLCDIAIRQFFSENRMSPKMFKHKVFTPEENVFMESEVEMLTNHFLTHKPNVVSYGIMLAFRTGLRVGELSSLTWDDITDHCIRINKTEVRYKQGSKTIHEIRDNAKTQAGNRYVLIDDKAMEIIEKIRELNPKGEYLFEIDGKRVLGQAFTMKLNRACKTLGITPRSMHKCRKTYATNLINANVPESLIVAQMGHIDIKTTRQYYLYNNTAKDKAIATLSAALGSNQNNQM